MKVTKGHKTSDRGADAALAARLANIVASSVNLDEVFAAFAEELRKLVEADRISVSIVEGDRLHVQALWSILPPPWEPGEVVPAAGTHAGWVVKHGKPIVEADTTKPSAFWTSARSVQMGVRSVAALPLMADGKAFGALVVLSRRAGAYGKREVDLLQLVARQIALPVRNSLVVKALQKADLLNKVVLDTLRIVSSGSLASSQEVFVSGVERLRQVVQFDSARFILLDDARENVEIWLVDFPLTERTVIHRTRPFLGSGTERVLLRGESVIEPDISKDGEFAIDERLAKEGFRTVLRVPLFFAGVSYGIFVLLGRRPGIFGEEERRIAETLCGVLSHVIWYQRLAAREEEARLKLQKESETRVRFIAMTAHELRTPLTVVLGSAHLLQGVAAAGRLAEDATTGKLLQNLVTGAKTMDARLQELVDLAKLDSGAFRIELAALDISQLLEELAAYFQSLAGERGQTLSVSMPGMLPVVKADRRRLEQVLMNLLRSALKYTPDGGKLALRAKALKTALVIEIQDGGPALSRDELDRMLQPTSDRQPDQEPLPGSALGLRLSKELMEAQKGTLSVTSTAKGNVFAISLPLLMGAGSS